MFSHFFILFSDHDFLMCGNTGAKQVFILVIKTSFGIILLWPVQLAGFFICLCCEDLRVLYLVMLAAGFKLRRDLCYPIRFCYLPLKQWVVQFSGGC